MKHKLLSLYESIYGLLSTVTCYVSATTSLETTRDVNTYDPPTATVHRVHSMRTRMDMSRCQVQLTTRSPHATLNNQQSTVNTHTTLIAECQEIAWMCGHGRAS